MARVFHVSGCFSYDFEYFKLLILIFLVYLRLPIHSHGVGMMPANDRNIMTSQTPLQLVYGLWSACRELHWSLFLIYLQ
jgi:hypothetical protein